MKYYQKGFVAMEHDVNIVDWEVGNRVKISREQSERSVEAAASHLKCSLEEYRLCEAGKKRFKAIHLIVLAKIFGVNLSQFFVDVGVFKTHFDLYPNRGLSRRRITPWILYSDY